MIIISNACIPRSATSPARHRFPRRQDRLRRRSRHRRNRPRRLPGFLRRDQSARRKQGPRALRQPVRMYHEITNEDAYKTPMRIYPAVHYTMGGLWVDYNLMSNLPGLFVLGEANFSDHGANRLGAKRADAGLERRLLRSAGDDQRLSRLAESRQAAQDRSVFKQAEKTSRASSRNCSATKGKRTPASFHKELGKIMGTLRHGAHQSWPRKAGIKKISCPNVRNTGGCQSPPAKRANGIKLETPDAWRTSSSWVN